MKKLEKYIPFLKNAFWNSYKQVITLVCGVATSAIIARICNKDTYGYYQFFLATFSILSLFTLPGLGTSLIISIAKGFDVNYAKSNVIRLKSSLILSTLFIAALIVFNYFFNFERFNFCILAALFVPASAYFKNWIGLLQGKKEYKKFALWSNIQSIITTLIFITMVYFSKNKLIALIGSYLFCDIFFNLLWYWKCRKFISNNEFDNSGIKYGYFLSGMSLCNLLYKHIEKIIMGIINPEILAIYAIANKLIDSLMVLIKKGFSTLLPYFAQQNEKQIKKRLILLVFSIGLIMAWICYLLSPWLITTLFSEKYINSINIFQKIVWIMPLIFVNNILGWKVIADKKKNIVFHIDISCALISLLISFIIYLNSKNIITFAIAKIYLIRVSHLIVHIFNFIRSQQSLGNQNLSS